ncbi:MAG: cytochrome c biogenesis protein CcsA [Bacteroidota bacterium]|nr:cytochrome c biogenesis protein CcsA [Candidatus Kapabacteria bacterium]MCS7302638.1 cytochrome c biogenesis protein CcsA [Candidatus Kapabacteria bacterium]MCX7936247.1 cytochrome c biogenesis protein CcsA [Chlorobiota bacterium]MDW8074472.1 cytochrome c biogenesis protein CcsA [Bacteroidota bacterium]MDW8271052.1 cytochrome c biogenesis protein CcsA [Bacteroidota bacterium]
MIAQFLIHLSLGIAVAFCWGYLTASLKKNTNALQSARALYYLYTLVLLIISALLLYALVTHNFDYSYVQAYSSRYLEPPFLYAAFYAGQEGSFLLWALVTSFVGIAVIEYSKKQGNEAEVMSFFSLVPLFLSLMLVAKNPFSFLWETYASEGSTRELIELIKIEQSRYEGRGLNPVLQNYWIMLHPPMLFSGFAMISVPYAFAMAGLLRREYHDWVRLTQPWIIAASLTLGIGITLGGFWAYETLGWGGFWAWDPVENSSLVPWLLTVSLFHTTLIQRRTKGLVRTNFVLVVAAFSAVLYSTFLTRSGVLGDTSVHSFVEPGFFVYVLLLIFLLGFTGLGVGLLLARFRDISSVSRRIGVFEPTSREFQLAVGAGLLIASAVIVLLGTSYPIAAELIGKPKVAIEPEFYNKTHFPLIALILLANGLSLIANWSTTPLFPAIRSIIPWIGISVLAGGAAFISGIVPSLAAAAVFACSAFALSINLRHIVRLISAAKYRALGAFISHAGLATLTAGVLVLSFTSKSAHLQLVENEPQRALGYTFTLLGREQVDLHLSDREKFRYPVLVESKSTRAIAYAIVYFSDFNQRQAPFLEPGIVRFAGEDVYISPKAIDEKPSYPVITLRKYIPAQLPTDTTWRIQLLAFDMSKAAANPNRSELELGVRVRLSSRKGETIDTTLYAIFDGQTFSPKMVSISSIDAALALLRIQRNQTAPDSSTATIGLISSKLDNSKPRNVLVVDASIKPMINLVWIGFLTMLGGMFISTVRSFRSSISAPRTMATTKDVSHQSTMHHHLTTPETEKQA